MDYLKIIKHLSLTLTVLLLFSAPAFPKSTIDPGEIGVGARPIGMGKAFIGLADDASAIFMNPAGISDFETNKFISMYTKLLGEVQYIVLGDTIPVSSGTLGIGLIGTRLDDSFITQRNPITQRIEQAGGVISSTSQVTYISFARNILPNLSAGISTKLFSQRLSNTSGGDASGLDLDLGLLWKINKHFTLGSTLTNALPGSLGGKLRWSTGIEESIPSSLKIGIASKLAGKNGIWQWGWGNLDFLLDAEHPILRSSLPTLVHSGIEWTPTNLLSLRLGLDQNAVSTGNSGMTTSNNISAGVGFKLGGFRFDLAFHQYENLSENNTYFFSIAYAVEALKQLGKEYIKILTLPLEKAVVYGSTVRLTGEIVVSDVAAIKINGEEVQIKDNSFSQNISLHLGKNIIEIEARGKEGRKLAFLKRYVLRLIAFSDIPKSFWAKDAIEKMATLGLIKGYPDNNFRPNEGLTRAQLATMLMRARGLKLEASTPASIFKDVPNSHWATAYVDAAVKLNLVKGYTDKTFKPEKMVSKSEGIVVMTRFSGIELPQIITADPFIDVLANHWAARYVTAAKAAGLLQNYIGKELNPEDNLTRAEAVEILSNTPPGKQLLSELD